MGVQCDILVTKLNRISLDLLFITSSFADETAKEVITSFWDSPITDPRFSPIEDISCDLGQRSSTYSWQKYRDL